MKQKILLTLMRFSLFLLLMAFYQVTQAQTITQTPENPFHPGTTGQEVFTWYSGLYALLITAFTYIQGALFPNASTSVPTVLRWVIIAGVIAAIFISLGWANGLQVFLGFIASALSYDKVLKPLGFETKKARTA